jgi:hypothetical protein
MEHRTERALAPLLITFLLEPEGRDIRLRCRGCRELDAAGRSASQDVAGRVEFDGESIDVLDMRHRLSGTAARIGASTCLVVVEGRGAHTPRRVGVLVRDLDEVMQLAAGEFTGGSQAPMSPNVRLILELCREQSGRELAEDTRPMSARLGAALRRLDDWLLSAAMA